MSVGEVTQSIDFIESDMTLVLGENLDLGGNDNRNGVGKSTIINALSYALYGSALTNIKKDNLINKTNEKGMLVTIEFEKDGQTYRIERGRKPGIFKFLVNGAAFNTEDVETNEAQGENRLTQIEIERTLGMSHTMFKNIVTLNTYNVPFLSMRASEQRELIEQLLGITKLSEKAETLRNLLKDTKDSIKEEEFRIKALQAANRRIEDNIKSLESKSSAWQRSHTQKIKDNEEALQVLKNVDIEQEIENHKKLASIKENEKKRKSYERELKSLQSDIQYYTKQLQDSENNLLSLKNKLCHTCGQELHDEQHESILADVEKHNRMLADSLENKLNAQEEIQKKYDALEVGAMPATFYDSIDEAYGHRSSISSFESILESDRNESNPYLDQIESLKNEGLQKIDYDKINTLVELRDHQDFLLKLLTSKDSFIRRRIIDQNIAYLNSRLAYYLAEMGLPHEVRFQSDLNVEITDYGRELDFDNLSRGERTRLILALSWAFRDVFESMNERINLLFIDELIDNGLDTSGMESSIKILKTMARDQARNIYLISHRDELIGRVSNVLHVIKEGGFTSFNSDVDTQIE